MSYSTQKMTYNSEIQLLKALSVMGVKVYHCENLQSYVVSKTISMSRLYANEKELVDKIEAMPKSLFVFLKDFYTNTSIGIDRADFITRRCVKLDNKTIGEKIDTLINTDSSSENYFYGGHRTKSKILKVINDAKHDVKTLHAEYYNIAFLRLVKSVNIDAGIKAYLNCKINDEGTQNNIFRVLYNIVFATANELFVDLSIQKANLDEKYLNPYKASLKIQKAKKGIYSVD